MAKRVKFDPKQTMFDFELAAVLAVQLEAERDMDEEEENHAQTGTDGTSLESAEFGSPVDDKQMPGHKSGWLFDFGSMGFESAPGVENFGGEPVLSSDSASGTAEPGRENSEPAGSPEPTGQGPGESRTVGNARSEHEPVKLRPSIQDIANASGGKIEIVTVGFEPKKTPKTSAAEPLKVSDYRISASDELGKGGAKAKFRDNILALKTLKRLQTAGASSASLEDQRLLVKYVGWGGLPHAFDPNNKNWKTEFEELRSLLNPIEYAAARRSTQDAHYTSQEVIEGIHQGLDRIGFQGPACILEPAAGVGHFFGLMPEKITGTKTYPVAVELDPCSAAIGQYLYPNVRFINKGFQDINTPNGHFDLVLGNPPFGNQKIYDSNRPDLDYSIHNYFLAKSIDSLRDGGVAAFVVSRYFLDAVNNPAREYIAERANLLGAIRLPNTAFKENALTEVTTDILFFQKTKTPELYPNWLSLNEIKDDAGNDIILNQYYVDHPEQMIGRMVMTGNMYGDAADLLPPDNFAGFKAEIGQRLEALPPGIYQSKNNVQYEAAKAQDDPNTRLCQRLKTDSFFVTYDGQIARRKPNIVDAQLGEIVQYEIYEPKNQQAVERIKGLIGIMEAQSSLMALELSDRSSSPVSLAGIEAKRAELNRLYDGFVKKHGNINSSANRQLMRDDPSFPLISALEREYDPGLSLEAAKKSGREAKAPSAVKADIFHKRVLGPRPVISKVETAKEALVVSMNEYGQPDLDYMAKICGRDKELLAAELGGLIYLNPKSRAWEVADHYLTGEVKNKLKDAIAAAADDSFFSANVAALEAVQPLDLDAVDIAVQLGSTWVPSSDMADFCTHLLGPDSVEGITYHPAMGQWAVSFNEYQIDKTLNESTWGTSRYTGHELIQAVLDYKPIIVRDRDGTDANGNPRYKINDEETAAAMQKAEEIKQAFKDWIWDDQERRERLVALYNDRFNTHVPRKYDGSHLTLPGSALNIKLRSHQKDAIWRGIQDGTVLFDHVVGSGKSYLAVATIMESRRMGLMKKPMVVVPNHLLQQWQDAFYTLYPQANILVAGKDDFKKENRQRLCGKLATGDWDAVVVAHSSFKKIGLPPKALEKILREQIDDLIDSIAELKREKGDHFTIKQMEKMRERLEEKMERSADTGQKDQALTFADLGVDALFVDESQEFKNLAFVSKMRNVAGLGNMSGSDKAFDLFVKARHIQMENDGRGLFFATGTPISNSIAEMYTVQRYLQYDLLREKGLSYFDAWASTFGEVVNGWELDATGVGYKVKERFAKFQNVPELTGLYRSVGDVITQGDLREQNKGKSFVPKIKGGKPRNIVVRRSERQARFMGVQEQLKDDEGQPRFYPDGSPVMGWTNGSIIWRMEHMPRDPRQDNPLKVTNDARKAGLDFRLIDPNAPDDEGSKVNVAADEITRVWKEWKSDKGTQLVFCDLSTPKLAKGSTKVSQPKAETEDQDDVVISMDELLADTSNFSVYDDLKAKLVGRGIPENEIRFIHEAKTDLQKAKLFEQVNKGEVRVLIGSTFKMGAGTNVQERLTALHHLDAPWRPSDLEQREGRIIRQGNKLFERDPDNFEIEIIRYATEQTYDARMWQVIQAKAEGIEQFRKGDNLARTIDDITSEAANAAEMKAAATGNELIFTQMKLAAELKKMEGIYASFKRGQHKLDNRISSLEKDPTRYDRTIADYRKEIELRNKNTTKEPYFAINGQLYGKDHRPALATEIMRLMKKSIDGEKTVKIGKYRGFEITAVTTVFDKKPYCGFSLEGQTGHYSPDTLIYGPREDLSINGFLQRIDNYLDKFETRIVEAQKSKERSAAELINARKNQGQTFPQMASLEALRQDNREIMAELQKMQKDPAYKSNWRTRSEDTNIGNKIISQADYGYPQ